MNEKANKVASQYFGRRITLDERGCYDDLTLSLRAWKSFNGKTILVKILEDELPAEYVTLDIS